MLNKLISTRFDQVWAYFSVVESFWNFVQSTTVMLDVVICAKFQNDSPASRVFTQPFVQAQIKEDIKAPCHWPSPVTGEFPAQRASNAENVCIWWRHHVMNIQMAGSCSPRVGAAWVKEQLDSGAKLRLVDVSNTKTGNLHEDYLKWVITAS